MALKTIFLTISERIAALAILNAFKGSLDKVAVILEDIKQLPITTEEWEAAGKTEVKNDKGEAVSWNWDNEKGGEKEITFQEATADFIRSDIKEKDEKNEFSLGDRALITLKEKLL
ncbi:MAG: hypothetical protein DDT19_02899 [Syntrophomonadaceae bacterium]|nr:hypothetical protein [Bacillota bacterium]